MKKILAAMSAALMMVALVSSVAVAKAPANNLLNHVAYYTVNNGSTFCRWATPQSSVVLPGGTASQSRNSASKAVSLSIANATGYADNGFYVPLGTLGALAGYTVLASDSFSTNLWFDTNIANDTKSNGNFFSWSGGCYSGLDGDSSSIGQPSTATATGTGQSVTVNDSSTFTLTCSGVYQTLTFAQLKAGDCAGINSTTPVAVWIGFSVNSGSHSTTITSAQATLTP